MKHKSSVTLPRLVSLGLALFSTLGLAAEPQWLAEATEKMNWNAASAYCAGKGARLPTEAEIQKEIKACGGTLTGDYFPDENEANENYQACMKSKGWEGDYWTSSTPAQSQTCALDIYIRRGNTGCGTKTESALKARCTLQK
ncbi:SUMF1/EgtB/PvdO family nonheme iron enzyme [Uliginosibacterium paludis]|uniref:SUMF1/EgtB/PvdO family nonheme iron enzyme n=1 Tax=Uliginosibacterium paludis TaxID=1615952 RepID=A0ABV2CQE1_9RHOO